MEGDAPSEPIFLGGEGNNGAGRAWSLGADGLQLVEPTLRRVVPTGRERLGESGALRGDGGYVWLKRRKAAKAAVLI
jgi:hypothetical protein